jgi:hypothetical protein
MAIAKRAGSMNESELNSTDASHIASARISATAGGGILSSRCFILQS